MTHPFTAPLTLSGRHATLEPLLPEHADAIAQAMRDGDLWKLWYTTIAAPEHMAAEVQRRLDLQAQGTMLPFTVRDATGTIVGMTTFMNIDARHRRVEIGSTCYARRAQRTALNTECKLLMLTHAFETWSCIAVELCTHALNTQSRRAIERLGAHLDGVRRNHGVMPNGTLRDTAIYSIIVSEWPTVRAHLEWQLERPR